MECPVCGTEFRPTNHNGKAQRYCSRSCKNRAAYLKRKARAAGDSGPSSSSVGEPVREKPAKVVIDRHSFDRMMDGSREDTLREIVAELRKALHDPATPANTLAPIATKLAEFDEKLRQSEGDTGLFDSEDEETTGVNADVGASIV